MGIESATVEHEGVKFEVSSNHLTQEELRGEAAKPAAEAVAPAAAAPAEKAAVAEGEVETEVELTPEQAASEAGKALQKKRGSYQTRIDELTKARYETQGELNAARTEIERLQKLIETAPAKPVEEPAAAVPQAPKKPELADFAAADDPYAAWMEALTDWKTDRRIEVLEAKQQKTQAERDEQVKLEREQSSAQHQRRQVVEAFTARVDKFKADHPDYQDVIESATVPDGPGKVPIFQYIEHTEMGPALAYHLCQHPAELVRIAALPPAMAIAALGKIEGRLEAQALPTGQVVAPATTTTPAAPAVSKAKPPLKVVGSSPVAVSDDDEPPPDAPFAVHKKYWDEKDRKAGLRV